MTKMKAEFERKIIALGVHFGAKDLRSFRKEKADIDFLRDSQIGENRLGKFFFIDKFYGNDYIHGTVAFSEILNSNSEFNLPDISVGLQWNQCAFLDTETTGLSQSAGTFAFMVGVAKIVDHQFLLRQYFLKSPSEEAAMLNDLENFLFGIKNIISYNGIGFDVPILRHRYILHKMRSPFEHFEHLDLLKYSRNLWRYQFEDRSLKSVEARILKYTRTSEEVPGWMAPEIYREFLKTGNFSVISGVFYHNAMDVISLCALLSRYIPILNAKEAGSNGFETINFAMGRLHEKYDNLKLSIMFYQSAIDQTDIPKTMKIQAIRQLSKIYKKSGNYKEAILLWETGSALTDVHCMIELAKYFEHKERNYEQAIFWVEKGLQTISFSKEYGLYHELMYRQQRIINKMEKNV